MKHLTVVIRTELEVPETWELVEHPAGMQVLKIGDQFVVFDLVPFSTRSTDALAEWSDADANLVGNVLDAVVESDAEFTVRLRH